MLTTVKGIYINRQVVLEETPETAGPVEVLVTFTDSVMPATPEQGNKRMFGAGKGMVLYMSPDFNEPLDDRKDYM
jgi:hypothetical protein